MDSRYGSSFPTHIATNAAIWDGPENQNAVDDFQHHPPFLPDAGILQPSYPAPGPYPLGPEFDMMAHEQHPQGTSHNHPPGLPQPQHILPSQTSSKACLACGKSSCSLMSHRAFSRNLTTAPRARPVLAAQTHASATPGTPVTAGHGLVDAIIQYPIAMDPERQHLLGLWSREWSPVSKGPERHLFPYRFIDKILPTASSHAPLFQALLAFSAAGWAQANNIVDEVAPRQLSFAVQILSQACPTEQAASTDEAMLAATLILLIYLNQGNGFEVGKHISGLVHLATVRGGPHYLGLAGIVAETLTYADHMQAIFFDRQPVWQLPLPPLDIGLPPQMGSGFRILSTTGEVDLHLLMAASSLCRVADIFQAASSKSGSLPTEARNSVGYLSNISEFQLARCNAMYNQMTSRDEIICLALILFDKVILRNEGAITPSIRKIEYRFWTCLEAPEGNNVMRNLLDTLPRLLLWLLMTGLTVCIRGDCQWKAVATEKMRLARIPAAISGWDQFRKDVLNHYVWLATAQEDTFKRLWLEVEGLKTTSSTKKSKG